MNKRNVILLLSITSALVLACGSGQLLEPTPTPTPTQTPTPSLTIFITGKLLYSDKAPAAGIEVIVHDYQEGQPAQIYYDTTTLEMINPGALTNEQGEFKIEAPRAFLIHNQFVLSGRLPFTESDLLRTSDDKTIIIVVQPDTTTVDLGEIIVN